MMRPVGTFSAVSTKRCASASWLGWISISFRADLAAFVQVGGARFFDDFFDDITSAGLVLPDANQSAV